MKAYLITPDSQQIDIIEISSMDDIVAKIGYDTLESDEIGNQGDRLYFDEECFLRGTSGRFQIDKLIPVSGKGVVIGSHEDGSLSDVMTSIDDINSRIQYL